MKDGFKILSDCWPLVVSIAPPRIDEAGLKDFFDQHRVLISRREKYVALTDVSPISEIPTATIRKKVADWTREMDPMVKQYNIGTSIVVSNSLVRGAITAIHWVVPPVQDTAIVATVYEAASFLFGVLEKHHIPVTPAMRQYRDSTRYAAR